MNTNESTECPDCGQEYIVRGRVRLCECNVTQEDMDDMDREHADEGREMNAAMGGGW
jgi:hypothetical protein